MARHRRRLGNWAKIGRKMRDAGVNKAWDLLQNLKSG